MFEVDMTKQGWTSEDCIVSTFDGGRRSVLERHGQYGGDNPQMDRTLYDITQREWGLVKILRTDRIYLHTGADGTGPIKPER